MRDSISLLHRLHGEEKIIVHFGESFIYGDSFAEDLSLNIAEHMLFVGDVRTSEWKNHIRRRLSGVNFRSFEFQRFAEEDYRQLSDAIIKYVPAPRFHKMEQDQRYREFDRYRSQLLIAMKEVTEYRKFREIITNEYINLPDDDCRICFLICGIATLARSGISLGMAKEAYNRLSGNRDFRDTLQDLQGIVSQDRNGRLVARHEVYVRHIIEGVAGASTIRNTITEILRSFTKFAVPIIRSFGRQEGVLFRFLLNHNFLRELFLVKNSSMMPNQIYSQFEIDFQRDGHYWLQYGQYLSSMKRYEEALPMLEKSIQAYPENDFAVHALADVQLRVARQSNAWDSSIADLVGQAVSALSRLHSDRQNLSDQYAIATLAKHHIGVLVKHNKMEEARDSARHYLDEIKNIENKIRDQELETLRVELTHFLVHGKMKPDNQEKVANRSRNHRRT